MALARLVPEDLHKFVLLVPECEYVVLLCGQPWPAHASDMNMHNYRYMHAGMLP